MDTERHPHRHARRDHARPRRGRLPRGRRRDRRLAHRRPRHRRAARPHRGASSTAARSTAAARPTERSPDDDRRQPLPARHRDRLRGARARARRSRRRAGEIIHLEIGEPDFDTPRAHRRGGRQGAPRRAHALLPRARACPCCARRAPSTCRATAASRSTRRRVLVTPGAKPFLFFGVLATCDPGDEVIYPNPGFPIYESVIRWAGATPVPLPLRRGDGLRVHRRRSGRAADAADEARDPQLARQPDRRRRDRAS